MKKVSPKEMKALRDYRNYYLSIRYPNLKLKNNSKSTLAELLGFWTNEQYNLKLENSKKENVFYKDMIAKGLAETQIIVKKYSKIDLSEGTKPLEHKLDVENG